MPTIDNETVTSTVTLSVGDSLTVTASGTINTTPSNYAVDGSGSIGTVSNSGLITGSVGIGTTHDIADVENTGGTIAGTVGGLDIIDSIGTVNNSGDIAGGDGDGIYSGSGIGSINNSSDISGSYGIFTYGSFNTLINTGLVSGNADDAIYLQNGVGLLTNFGVISSGSSDGIRNFGGGMILNTASATISGGGSFGRGIEEFPGGGTIENAGTISGGIQFYSNGSTLILDSGFVVNGSVSTYGSNDTLELGTGPVSVSGIGTQYTNFGTIAFTNTDGTAEGNASGIANGQQITGFTNGDTLILDGFVATSGTYVTYTGLVLTDSVSNTETLDIIGTNGSADSYGNSDFDITNDGTNTIIVKVLNTTTISTTVNNTVTINQYDNLIVTDTGAVTQGVTADTAGTISNDGSISAISANAIGSLTNAGTIASEGEAIQIEDKLGELTNSGTIYSAHSDAIVAIDGGTVINAAGGLISAESVAIDMNQAGTIENAGSIVGDSSSGAINFEASGSTMVLETGSTITGNVVDYAHDGALDLETTGTFTVDSSSSGSGQYLGFTTIAFGNTDPTVAGTESGLTGDTITGFGSADAIDVTDLVATGTVTADGSGVVTLDSGGLILNFGTADANHVFTLTSDGDAGTLIVCYYPGTGIRTPSGDVAVEALAAGDAVVLADGREMPVRWIGRNTVSTRFTDPLRVLPIRIRAGALAEGLPERDLLVSPEHAVFVDDILIQAGALVNDLSIIRERDVPETFTYYHVELAEHALILAEGTPAESFVDNCHRMAFENWAEHEARHGAAPIREMRYPRAQSHRQVPIDIRAHLMERASGLFGEDARRVA